MKINKLSQKILASVLMIAVLICTMFFLTACSIGGGDDESISKLDKRLSELKTQLDEVNQQNQEAISDLESKLEIKQNQLNKANEEIQEMKSALDNISNLTLFKNCISNARSVFSQSSIPLITPIEEARSLSSIGLEYEDNYSEIPNDFDCGMGFLSPFYNYGLDILNYFVNSDFANIGKVCSFTYSNWLTYILIDVDYTQNTLTFYIKRLNNSKPYDCIEGVIECKQNFSNWENIVIKRDAENDVGAILIAKNSATVEDSLDNLNAFAINKGSLMAFYGIDFDTNYYALYEDTEETPIPTTIEKYLMSNYIASFNVNTNVYNALFV